MDEIRYQPIGVARTRYKSLEGMPLQPSAVRDERGLIHIHYEYAAGLKDLDGFSHIHVIAHMHQGKPGNLVGIPFLDDKPRGVFSTRSPRHPNPIGLSTVRLINVEETVLFVAGLDLLDRTPILDLKPYVPEFDQQDADRIGWLAQRAQNVHSTRADDRFTR
jgi:tRNA-Thr(GGU) m(6)t(6)A37 methyltransferase TsaA